MKSLNRRRLMGEQSCLGGYDGEKHTVCPIAPDTLIFHCIKRIQRTSICSSNFLFQPKVVLPGFTPNFHPLSSPSVTGVKHRGTPC